MSDVHYLPPLKQNSNNNSIRQQAYYLSTPETTAFDVLVYQGSNPTPVATLSSLSATNSIEYALADGDNDISLITNTNSGIILSNSGLRFESAGGQDFYVNYRGRSNNQATSLTSKGKKALGTLFKWGGLPLRAGSSDQSASLGIMATEDNTIVTITGYDPACEFRLQNDPDGITSDTVTVTLNSGQCYVLEAREVEGTANEDGWLGATISSDKNVAISNGSMNAGFVGNSRDAGIDQPVPENLLGKEYVYIRGNGTNLLEFPIIIAIENNTEIYVNDLATPIATINAGDFFEIPGENYSSNSAGANMYVRTSKNAYAYQSLSGASANQTGGLNFLAPLNCLMADEVNFIPNVRTIQGKSDYVGAITITASASTPDTNILVTDDNGVVVLPASSSVLGTDDWKTFFISDLTGDVTVQSTGPVAVGFFGRNNNAGYGGYFSGFDVAPVVNLQIVGTNCLPSTFEVVNPNFDSYQWYGDGAIILGANGTSYTPTTAGDYFIRVLKGGCYYDSNPLSAYYCNPDIVLNKEADKDTIQEGETVTFTITVNSLGVDPITNLVITDVLPAGLTVTNVNVSKGTWSDPNWIIGTMNQGDLETMTLEAIADDLINVGSSQTLVNTVTNSSDQADTNITTDNPSAAVTIIYDDNDNDGVIDAIDLDDDNDGILDEYECGTITDPFVNGSFEEPIIPVATFSLINQALVPGWSTTASDGLIEIWHSGHQGVMAQEGNQFVELNANEVSTLYQSFSLNGLGGTIDWSLYHRGRAGVEVANVLIGENLSSTTNEQVMSDGMSWGYYAGTYHIPVGQTQIIIAFESTVGGSIGNFLDNIQININQGCLDSDNDGITDNFDLDSDNDGCNDTEEENINDPDGDGIAGTGVPTVDANGLVTSITYTNPPNNVWQTNCNATCSYTLPCDDGNPCTTGEFEVFNNSGIVCEPCGGGTSTDCSNGNTSTLACDDGNPFTVNDTKTILDCDGSVCVPCQGTPVDCNNGTTSVMPCDDGNSCTINDEQIVLDSDGSICVPCSGTPTDCDNGNTSTVACDDGNPFTTNDIQIILDCDGSVCVPCQGTPVDCNNGTTSVMPCDDGNSCTINDEQIVLDSDG
ncbi:MAG: DUF11 domain-containing protein, partial [Bacteroidota bacterium]